MSKQALFHEDAKDSLLSGIRKLYMAVSATLGPLGSNVALDRPWGAPNVIHDGVSVAREISLKDPFENMGAQLVKEAASKTNDVSGDGTTTSTILAYHIVKAFIRKGNPMRIRKQMLEECRELSQSLKDHSIPVEDITHIATISAQDEEIGKVISEAFKKLGKNGLVSVEEGRGTEISVEYKEGMEFDRGYASAYFATNADRMEAEIENPTILITDKKLSTLEEIKQILEIMMAESNNIVIIADDIDGEALATLVYNKIKGVLNVLAIKAPGFGDRRREMLEDIAVLTGGRVITQESGETVKSITPQDFGHADKVWSDKENSRIIGGKGDKDELDSQIQKIKNLIDKSTSDFDKEEYQKRLSKLTNGAAIINIGARTEVELKEKKERAIDAVAASRAALEEGVLPGGASSLIYLCKGGLLKEVVTKPFEVLMENSELTHTPEELKEFGFAFDVIDGEYKDMVKAGIVDPTKVVREALENAVSVATSILTTKVLITDYKEEKNA